MWKNGPFASRIGVLKTDFAWMDYRIVLEREARFRVTLVRSRGSAGA